MCIRDSSNICFASIRLYRQKTKDYVCSSTCYLKLNLSASPMFLNKSTAALNYQCIFCTTYYLNHFNHNAVIPRRKRLYFAFIHLIMINTSISKYLNAYTVSCHKLNVTWNNEEMCIRDRCPLGSCTLWLWYDCYYTYDYTHYYDCLLYTSRCV